MASRTFLRFEHRCDLHTRTVTTSPAGQEISSFSAANTSVPCSLQMFASERRVAPYVDNVDQYQIIVPAMYSSDIAYTTRVLNIKDRYGNTIEAGAFEIDEILKRTTFNGKVSLFVLGLRLVVENG